MLEKHAKRIQETATAVGIECDLRENYVGRGMHNPTAGVVVSNMPDFTYVLMQTVIAILEDTSNATGLADDFAEDLCDYKTDNLGHDFIVY